MSLTRTAARDEILALFKAAADGLTSAQLDPENILYQGSRSGRIPSGELTPAPNWARVSVQHSLGSQDAINPNVGQRSYTRSGIVSVQLFTGRDGLTSADVIAEAIEAAFLGVSTPGGVWFRNVRSVEIGEDGPWFQTNILAEFVYEQTR